MRIGWRQAVAIRAGKRHIRIGPNRRYVACRDRAVTPAVRAACRLPIPSGDMSTLGRHVCKGDLGGRPIINMPRIADIRNARGRDVTIAARDGTTHLSPGYVRLMRTHSNCGHRGVARKIRRRRSRCTASVATAAIKCHEVHIAVYSTVYVALGSNEVSILIDDRAMATRAIRNLGMTLG